MLMSLLTLYLRNDLSLTHLCLQTALTLLQLRDVSSALGQHGLLLLERELQLQVLLVGALTNQAGTVELLLQRGHLRMQEQARS